MSLSTIAGLLALALSLPVHAGTTYQLTDLGSLKPDRRARAIGVNNRGDVVGWSYKTRHVYHAFKFKDGVMKDLGSLGDDFSVAVAINDDGEAIGWSTAPNSSAIHAFVHRRGALVDLGTLGGLNSYALGINSGGQVVGQAERPNGDTHAFLHQHGKMIDLGTLGGNFSAANAINDAGQVVGWSSKTPTANPRAFLHSNGEMTDLGANQGTSSAAVAINATGEIAGYYTESSGDFIAFLYSGGEIHPLGQLKERPWCLPAAINDKAEIVGSCRFATRSSSSAFLYREGQMIDLSKQLDPETGAGWTLYDASGINSAGQIVGAGRQKPGLLRAYLLTPITR